MRHGVTWATVPIVALAFAFGTAAAAPAGSGAARATGAFRPKAQQVVCESRQFRQTNCAVDTRGGVRLLQQTGGVCTYARTWGTDRRGIWVTNGCRGIFAAVPGRGGHPASGPGRLIVCESWRFQPSRCAAHLTRRPRVEVIAGTCIEGRTWRWNRRGVTVAGGCRARFLVS